MGLEDLDQVMAIERASFSAPWSKNLFLSELRNTAVSTLLVALDDMAAERQVVGYMGIWVVAEEMHILNLAVAENERRQGIGKKLVLNALRYAYAQGARIAYLEVRESNTAAQNLYGGLHFTRVGVRQGYYESPRENAVVMELDEEDFLNLLKGEEAK